MLILIFLMGTFLIALFIYIYYINLIANQESIATNEIYYVRTKDLWEIRVCRFRKGSEKNIPILFVHGFGSNQNNFLLPQGYSMVDFFKEHNYDCWTMEMRCCKSSKPPFEKSYKDASMDDVLLYDLPAVIDFIRNITGFEKIFWIGHSLGGMMLYAYLLYHGNNKLAGGITLGAPIGFLKTKMNAPEFVIKFEKMFPELGISLMRSLIPILKYLKIGNPLFPVNPLNLHPQMTAQYLCKMVERPSPKMLDTIIKWFKEQRWEMVNGKLDVLANLHKLDIPLLLFFASDDPFVNLETAHSFFNSIDYSDKKMIILSKENNCKHNYNHCDLAFGENGEEEVFKPTLTWLEEHIPYVSEFSDISNQKKDKKVQNKIGLTKDERKNILSGHAFSSNSSKTIKKKKKEDNSVNKTD